MLIGLLKFLFWFFFISYLVKMLTRFLAPILIKRFANKMHDTFNHNFNQRGQDQHKKSQNEGDVTIEKNNNSTKKKPDDIGEYVDFEELE